MRTDVGTFVFKLHSQAKVAKITLEYPGSSDPIVFHLRHHPPNREAAIQLSGHLLEVEATETLVGKIFQAEVDNRFRKRWERDRRCMECGQHRKRFFPVCTDCLYSAPDFSGQ